MLVKNLKASAFFKLFIAVCGTCALFYETDLWMGTYRQDFHYFFTNISNLVVVIYFWIASVRQLKGLETDQSPWCPKLKHALMLAISVTGLVAFFMLNYGNVFKGGVFHPELLVTHYIVPIGTIADWIIFDRKGTMSFGEVPTWPIFPLLYLSYAFALVLGCGVWMREESRWPYPFLDIDTKGSTEVLITCIVLVVVFVLLGCLYVAIDQAMAKRFRLKSAARYAKM